jgi:hypothetical protein
MQTRLSPHVQRLAARMLVALTTSAAAGAAANPTTAVEGANECFSGRTGPVGVIDHATAAEDIVLQMSFGEGSRRSVSMTLPTRKLASDSRRWPSC